MSGKFYDGDGWAGLIAGHLAAHPFAPPAEKARYVWPLARPNLTADDIAAALRVLLSGHTTCWREVAAFEEEFAMRFAPGRAAVMVNSGSSANLLAAELLARRIGRGAEVIIPAVTWPTHVCAALQAGLRVRLCGVDPARWTAGPGDVEEAATPQTRAVWPVHPLGLVADVPGLRALAAHRGWTVLEDCCDALGGHDAQGAPVGTRSLAGTFSLFYSHAMTSLEGGMIVVDPEDAPALRAWRSHGWARDLPDPDARRVLPGGAEGPFVFADTGWNLRPTEVQAAIGRSQIARWDATLAARRVATDWWRGVIRGLPQRDIRGRGLLRQLTDSVPVIADGDALHGLPFVGIGPSSMTWFREQMDVAGIETRPILAGDLREQPFVRVAVRDGRITWHERGNWTGTAVAHRSAAYIGLLPHAPAATRARLADALRTIAASANNP